MSKGDEQILHLGDLAEQPEDADAAPKEIADPKEIGLCFDFLKSGQFSEARNREARGKFSKPAYIGALQRKRMMETTDRT